MYLHLEPTKDDACNVNGKKNSEIAQCSFFINCNGNITESTLYNRKYLPIAPILRKKLPWL